MRRRAAKRRALHSRPASVSFRTMTAPTSTGAAAPAGARAARAFRYLYRLPFLVWHVLIHLPLAMALTTPVTRRLRWGEESLEHRVIRAWSAGLLHVFGFRLQRFGTPLPGATMFVANHVSWLDIETLHSQRM